MALGHSLSQSAERLKCDHLLSDGCCCAQSRPCPARGPCALLVQLEFRWTPIKQAAGIDLMAVSVISTKSKLLK